MKSRVAFKPTCLDRAGELGESMSQSWDAGQYARQGRFVADLAGGVFDLLAARAGERILDLGCGDGALTAKIVATGAQVVGVDSSPSMVEAALTRGLDA